MSSFHFELPPSMMVSPLARMPVRAWIVFSVGSPAGTMTHTARGAASLAKPSSEGVSVAPLASASLAALGEGS